MEDTEYMRRWAEAEAELTPCIERGCPYLGTFGCTIDDCPQRYKNGEKGTKNERL